MNSDVKAALQGQATHAWSLKGKGTIAMGTGTGKTKIAIDRMMKIYHEEGQQNFLVAVPTEILRDENWPEEVKKWYGDKGMEMWNTCVTAVCYVSLPRLTGDFRFGVFDEIHRLTDHNISVFSNTAIDQVMGLTATPPDPKRDPHKAHFLHMFAPVCFVYSLDSGVEDSLISDFIINVIMHPLDAVNLDIKAGTKAKPFMTTESRMYTYLDGTCNRCFAMPPGPRKESAVKFATLKRMRFLYDLPSKTTSARRIIDLYNQIDSKRRLIFCGSIEQANTLMGDNVYHSKSGKSALDKFMKEEIHQLGVVNAVNEGVNIPALDGELIVQGNSNERDWVQRIGRSVRFRPGLIAEVDVLVTQGTKDEEWAKKALTNFDHKRIYYHTEEQFIRNLERQIVG